MNHHHVRQLIYQLCVAAVLCTPMRLLAADYSRKELPVIADAKTVVQPRKEITSPPKTQALGYGYWDSTTSHSFNGPVFVFTQGGEPPYYVGGGFDSVDGQPLENIGHYDFRNYYPLAGGVHGGPVYTIIQTYVSDELFVGGKFTSADGKPANHIAHWTGSAWEALGEGVDTTVLTMAMFHGSLYVGGNFTHAGGVAANHIARWDFTLKKWLPVISNGINGVNGGVAAMFAAADDSSLYVAGGFTGAGAVPANKIAKFDGATWSALGSGIGGTNAYVSAFSRSVNNLIYVCGEFTTAGGLPANNIVSWDMTSHTWNSVGTGANNGVDAAVYALLFDGSLLVATGDFLHAGSIAANHIAYCLRDSSRWYSMGAGIDQAGFALEGMCLHVTSTQGIGSCRIFVGGEFSRAGDTTAASFARWNMDGGDDGVDQPPRIDRGSPLFMQLYPIPIAAASPTLSLQFNLSRAAQPTVQMRDILGRCVSRQSLDRLDAGSHTAMINTDRLLAGTYFCTLSAGNVVETRRVVVR